MNFSSGDTTSEAADIVVSVNNYTLTDLVRDDNFDIVNNSRTAGDARVKFTYKNAGTVTDFTSGSIVITAGDTAGDLSIHQLVVVTQGAAETTTGSLTTYTIDVDPSVSSEDLTGTFTTASDGTSQAAQLATMMNAQSSLGAVSAANVVTNTFVEGRDVVNTSVTYTGGTGSTATNPPTTVTRDGVNVVSVLSAWSIPFQAGSQGPAGESGPQGESGFSTLTGQGDPLQTDGKNDDIYFNQINGRVWQKTNGIWVDTGNTFKGADGTPGADSIRVQVYVKDAAGVNFRNNTGAVKVLRVNVLSGGAIFTDAQHNAFTYTWYKGTTQLVSGISLREYSVSAEDVPDDGDSEYTCRVTSSIQ